MKDRYGIKQSSRVVIVGLGPRTMSMAPINLQTDVWTMNRGVEIVSPVDVVFDLHPCEELTAEHVEKLRSCGKPVFLQSQHPGIPLSLQFPLQDLIKRFGYVFGNTIVYLIGFAILLGYRRISLYGIEMDYPEYYRTQKPNVMYFIGLARGMGIKVDWPKEVNLTNWGLYGYSMLDILQEAGEILDN